VIVNIEWMQKRGTDWDFANYCVVRPYSHRGYACIHTFFLAAFTLDGDNDAEDLANVRTLCEIHYQQSFSGEPDEKTA
jgi:hypothetical protein